MNRREFLKSLSAIPVAGSVPVRKPSGRTLKKNLFKKMLFEKSPAG